MILSVPTLYAARVRPARSRKDYAVFVPTYVPVELIEVEAVRSNARYPVASEMVGDTLVDWWQTESGTIRPVLGKDGARVTPEDVQSARSRDLLGNFENASTGWWADHPGAVDEQSLSPDLRVGLLNPPENHFLNQNRARVWDTSDAKWFEAAATYQALKLVLFRGELFKYAPLPGTIVWVDHDGPHLARWIDPFLPTKRTGIYFSHAEYQIALRCFRLLATRKRFPQSLKCETLDPEPNASFRTVQSAVALLERTMVPKWWMSDALMDAYRRARFPRLSDRSGSDEILDRLLFAIEEQNRAALQPLQTMLSARKLSFRGPSDVDGDDIPDAELYRAPPTEVRILTDEERDDDFDSLAFDQ